MTEQNRFMGSVVPFRRRWHVIQEVDLARLIREHYRRARLCDRLERLADALPELPGGEQVAEIRNDLAELVARNEHEELPYLRSMLVNDSGDALTTALLEHVAARHAADAAAAEELDWALQSAVPGGDGVPPAVLGYMLRCFFDGCRRAIDFEQMTILTVAGHRLTTEARAVLVDALAERVDHPAGALA